MNDSEDDDARREDDGIRWDEDGDPIAVGVSATNGKFEDDELEAEMIEEG